MTTALEFSEHVHSTAKPHRMSLLNPQRLRCHDCAVTLTLPTDPAELDVAVSSASRSGEREDRELVSVQTTDRAEQPIVLFVPAAEVWVDAQQAREIAGMLRLAARALDDDRR